MSIAFKLGWKTSDRWASSADHAFIFVPVSSWDTRACESPNTTLPSRHSKHSNITEIQLSFTPCGGGGTRCCCPPAESAQTAPSHPINTRTSGAIAVATYWYRVDANVYTPALIIC